MVLTLHLKQVTTYRVEVSQTNLSSFLNTDNFEQFFKYLKGRNIEIFHYPQLNKYHLTGLYYEEMLEEIGRFCALKVIFKITQF
jgi:hypothetical protein